MRREIDIDIEIEGNTLTLKGKRDIEKETKEENYHRIERFYGSFYRSLNLLSYVNPEKIKAEHDKGLLKITMPKKPELESIKVKPLKKTKPKKK